MSIANPPPVVIPDTKPSLLSRAMAAYQALAQADQAACNAARERWRAELRQLARDCFRTLLDWTPASVTADPEGDFAFAEPAAGVRITYHTDTETSYWSVSVAYLCPACGEPWNECGIAGGHAGPHRAEDAIARLGKWVQESAVYEDNLCGACYAAQVCADGAARRRAS